jgi:hypothetical protein
VIAAQCEWLEGGLQRPKLVCQPIGSSDHLPVGGSFGCLHLGERVLPSQGAVIAVDPHKASWTAVVVTAGLAAAGSVRVEANRRLSGAATLCRGLARCSLAIEGAAGLGAPVAERPGEDGITVVDVPAKAGPPRAAALDRARSQERPGRCARLIG